jgi:DNA-binding MurR/RpiR family transcriptional regulator
MTDQTTRHLLIQSAIALIGSVPTIRAMRARLLADGVHASVKTIARDYQRLGLRSASPVGRKPTGETTITVEHRIHVADYDAACKLARQRGVSVAAILRSLVAIGLRAKRQPAA